MPQTYGYTHRGAETYNFLDENEHHLHEHLSASVCHPYREPSDTDLSYPSTSMHDPVVYPCLHLGKLAPHFAAKLYDLFYGNECNLFRISSRLGGVI